VAARIARVVNPSSIAGSYTGAGRRPCRQPV